MGKGQGNAPGTQPIPSGTALKGHNTHRLSACRPRPEPSAGWPCREGWEDAVAPFQGRGHSPGPLSRGVAPGWFVPAPSGRNPAPSVSGASGQGGWHPVPVRMLKSLLLQGFLHDPACGLSGQSSMLLSRRNRATDWIAGNRTGRAFARGGILCRAFRASTTHRSPSSPQSPGERSECAGPWHHGARSHRASARRSGR
jgi:hypothetical protein